MPINKITMTASTYLKFPRCHRLLFAFILTYLFSAQNNPVRELIHNS